MCEALSTRGFEYMDENGVDDELKCIICTEPFLDPVTISICGHTFCRSEIEIVFEETGVCPQCQTSISNHEWESVNDNLVNMLSKISVKCKYCGQMNIQRGHFNEHIQRICSKVPVSCPNVAEHCEWTGPRDQVLNHTTQCNAETKKYFLSQFKDITKHIEQVQLKIQKSRLEGMNIPINNEPLIPQVQHFSQECMKLETENRKLKSQVENIILKNQSLESQVADVATKNEYLESQIKNLFVQNKTLKSDVQIMRAESEKDAYQTNALSDKNQQLKCELENLAINPEYLISEVQDLRAKREHAECQIKDLSDKNKQLESELKNLAVNREHLISEVEDLKTKKEQDEHKMNDFLGEKQNLHSGLKRAEVYQKDLKFEKSRKSERKHLSNNNKKHSHSCVHGTKCVVS